MSEQYFDIWPGNLKSIELRGGMNETEMWMLKERMDAGGVKLLQGPDAAFGRAGQYHSLFGDEGGTYMIATHGNPVKNDAFYGWCFISLINKLDPATASKFLSGWPYE